MTADPDRPPPRRSARSPTARSQPKPFQPLDLRRPRRRDRRPDREHPRRTGSSSPWSSRPDRATGWEVISGHRRLACARAPGPGRRPLRGPRRSAAEAARRRAVLEYNRQRRKTFSQMMREADALEALLAAEAPRRRAAPTSASSERAADAARSSEFRRSGAVAPTPRSPAPSASAARTSTARPAPSGRSPGRATPAPGAASPSSTPGPRRSMPLTRTCAAATASRAGFRPTPYDVWAFQHDRAFGIPHPGSIPPGHRRPHPPLLHRPRRPGRRPDGRRRDHARRLRVDGTPLPCV